MRFGERVNLVGERVPVVMAVDEEFLKGAKRKRCFEGSHGIDLDAIAGGEDHRFSRDARFAQGLQYHRNARLREGEPLPYRDR